MQPFYSTQLFVNAKTLSSALTVVGRSISNKPTHPVLGCVKLTTRESDAVLTGFDMATATVYRIPIDNLAGELSTICIPYTLLSTLVSKLSGDLKLLVADLELTIESETGKYQLTLLDTENYPSLPVVEGETINLAGDTLREAIDTVASCASTDDGKQVLCGVNLQSDNGTLYFSATNGHVLAQYWSEGCQDDISVTIPTNALQSVAKHTDGDIQMKLNDTQVEFYSGDLKVIARVLQGAYPKVKQLIPTQFERTATVDAPTLKSAISRVATFADDKNNVLQLNFLDDELGLSTSAHERGMGSEVIASQLNGEPIQLASNLKYLNIGINALDSKTITFNINHDNQPVIIKGNDHSLFLLMPIALRE